MTENKMAELEISQTKCVCGKELPPSSLVRHKSGCPVYHKWLDNHQREIVEFSLEHTQDETKRRFRIGSRILHVLRIQTGIEKLSDLPHYTRKEAEASLRYHHLVVNSNKPLAVVTDSVTPLKQKMEQAKEMNRQGLSLRQIAEKMNVSRSTIHFWIKSYPEEKKTTPPSPPSDKMDFAAFIAQMNQGTFWREFSKASNAGELMVLMMIRFLTDYGAIKRRVSEQDKALMSWEEKCLHLQNSLTSTEATAKLLIHQRDNALVQAAQNAFCESGEA